jgi:hypothetical protein
LGVTGKSRLKRPQIHHRLPKPLQANLLAFLPMKEMIRPL